VGPAVLKMLRSLGVKDSLAGADRPCSQGMESALKKHRAQIAPTEVLQPSGVPDFNQRLARDLRKMAPDHPAYFLDSIADDLENPRLSDRYGLSEDPKTLQLLLRVPWVRPCLRNSPKLLKEGQPPLPPQQQQQLLICP